MKSWRPSGNASTWRVPPGSWKVITCTRSCAWPAASVRNAFQCHTSHRASTGEVMSAVNSPSRGNATEAWSSNAFVAFHVDQWRETGRRSRFAYDEVQARRSLAAAGFAVEHLEVEREVQCFGSVEEGLAAAVGLEVPVNRTIWAALKPSAEGARPN